MKKDYYVNNSRKLIAFMALAALVIIAALLLITALAKTRSASNDINATVTEVPISTAVVTELVLSTPLPTIMHTPSPTPTQEPIDKEFLILVNWDCPIYSELPVVLLTDVMTAPNVRFDERKHVNEAAGRALNDMLTAAAEQGQFDFLISSAFRYIYEQEMLWNRKAQHDPNYGKDPFNNPVGTMPKNMSEHTTGLAIDLLSGANEYTSASFAHTPEGEWLHKNAHNYGFILRYPADKTHVTGVKYEPWHFRYVGVEHATYMYENGLCLEEYLRLLGLYPGE